MKRIFTLVILLLSGVLSYAQTSEDVAVELTAKTSEAPASITLQWKKITAYTPAYSIYKKAKTATSWGSAIATLTATDSTYVDNAVIIDSGYEYQVFASVGSTAKASGYIYAGIREKPIYNRGAIIMVVDSTFTDSCKAELKTLMDDLSGDGWQVIRHDFNRVATDVTIKAAISADYTKYANVKSVFLIGHVAVPYSGDLNPDGHPDHLGAWPADVFYGVMSGAWNDVSINDVSAGYTSNHNIPGDGKWDATAIPGTVVLQVGRVDFYNMPAFASTEVQLMKRYLNKEHSYKLDGLPMRHRGIISDNFGYFSGEAFAANGWRNFAPLVGTDSLTVTPSAYISSMNTDTYQWGYATGGGSFTSASGIGVTTDFTTNGMNTIFTMTFGSYFGDWNVTNNFLRAPLCANPPALTNAWAGRPNWFVHHMALGENIGYGEVLTQNNSGTLYGPSNYGAGWVHIALLGDPSLRTDYIKPSAITSITKGYHMGATINWAASADPLVIGYHVYRADSAYGYFQRITDKMITVTNYHDITGISGLKYYMVRPVKLTTTPSGKYYNIGLGLTDTATVSFGPLDVVSVQPQAHLSVFPNPASGFINVTVSSDAQAVAGMVIVNAMGQQFYPVTKQLNVGENRYTLNVAEMSPGVYTLVVKIGTETFTEKWVKL